MRGALVHVPFALAALAVLAALAASSAIVFGAAACSVEATKYGPPESLRSVREPDGGYVIPKVDASAERPCPAGSVEPDKGCVVQWARDIYEPLVRVKWGCTAGNCHDGYSPPQISDNNAKLARRELTFVTTRGKPSTPYVNTCSKDPQASSILCNLNVQGTLATCGRPMPLERAPLTPADLDTLKQWLACGAPDN